MSYCFIVFAFSILIYNTIFIKKKDRYGKSITQNVKNKQKHKPSNWKYVASNMLR